MRARNAYAMVLADIDTHASVFEQYGTILDLLRLSVRDNLGVRDIFPALMIRLDRDQEAYNFIKWWSRQDGDSNFEGGYSKVVDSDILESPDFMTDSKWVNFQ